jgi:hypothetical protein
VFRLTFKNHFAMINKLWLLVTMQAATIGFALAQNQVVWDFNYPGERSNKECLLDLRYLNEKMAGDHGFITQSSSGEDFVRGDGQPVRFWAVNLDAQLFTITDSALASCARFLAKMGVNMIRLHCSINPYQKDSKITDVDTAEVRTIWRFMAFMKNEGIYTTLSPYWAHNWFMGEWIPPSWNLCGYKEKDHLWGVMFFNDDLKNAYKQWVKYLYTTVNPYTGIALKDDPALAIIQIKNEDGVFWKSMDEFMKPEFKECVAEKFAAWLIPQYGSVQNAFNAWGKARLPADNPLTGQLDLFTIHDMTLQQTGDTAKRIHDQVRFYSETQLGFYREMYEYYRNELQCRHLINGNNWRAADPALLNDLERYTNTACDVMAVNRYVANQHIGNNCTWSIEPGNYFSSGSLMTKPAQLPVNIKQVKEKTFIVSESSWLMPNKYMTEAPFMIAAYQSLTGVDAYYWFIITDPDYNNQYWKQYPLDTTYWIPIVCPEYKDSIHAAPVKKITQYPLQHFSASTPFTMGMFPANALTFRMGLIRESPPVLSEERSMQSLLNRKVPAIFEEGYDSNRDQDLFRPDTSDQQSFNQLLFLTGKVLASYNVPVDKTILMPGIEKYIDQQNQVITSVTGELSWDYANGICTLAAPKAQGVCGFINKKAFYQLPAVRITSSNQYGTVQVVAMDDQPIEKSRKLLVQVGTQYLPTGWEDKPARFEFRGYMLDGLQILSTGTMPWQAVNTEVSLEIKNKHLSKATLLDPGGYPISAVKMVRNNEKFMITLPGNTMYMIIE